MVTKNKKRDDNNLYSMGAVADLKQMAPSHTVQEGDTLNDIASKFGVGIDRLSGYRSGNPDLIYPGETITVSGQSANPAPTVDPTSRVEAVREELGGTTPTEQMTGQTPENFEGFGYSSLQKQLEQSQANREKAFKEFEGFRTKRYEELSRDRDLESKRSKISELDEQIAEAKAERDASIAKFRSNPGASAATITGDVSVATSKLNSNINNLISQRNALTNEYNGTLEEIDGLVNREAEDLQSTLGYYDQSATRNQELINAFQKSLLDELRREQDREYAESDSLTDFERALELIQEKARHDTGAGTKYTILTDPFGQAVMAIDPKNPTDIIDLTGLGEVPETQIGGAKAPASEIVPVKESESPGFWASLRNLFKRN